VKVEPDMLKLAQHILQSKATDFDPSQFVDHYEEAVVEMLKKKQAGIAVSRERATPRPQNVVNLMKALRRSIAQEKAVSTPPKKGRKRIEGQGEMLLPIAGKKGKQATAKLAERASARQKNAG
jgi:DNA end-binding protein Ku